MIGFRINVRASKVRGDMNAFTKHLRKVTEDVMTQEFCLTARAALKYAPPLVQAGGRGDTAAAGRVGEKAIDKDVRAIFAEKYSTLPAVFSSGKLAGSKSAFDKWRSKPFVSSSSTLLTKIYYDADPDRAYQKAKNIFHGKASRSKTLDNLGAMSKVHRQFRRNGRVVREGMPDKETKRYPYIVKEAMIRKYVKLRARAIGKLKSGWYELINRFGRGLVIFGRTVDAGAKGLPKYITRHQGPGYVRKNFAGHTLKITIRNEIGDNDGAGLRARTYDLVIRDRIAAVAKRPYQTYANKLVRNWNKNLKPGTA